ncbi:hypothetical protein [Paenibacillus tengchongensis]|uniref:hypothetical protein n=1 Tax=Paenibacillus tengchongensis TaxID=2608684 RepID=UPI00124D823C|nr:hypothetical protein [Paenibacillus tengchongensis]
MLKRITTTGIPAAPDFAGRISGKYGILRHRQALTGLILRKLSFQLSGWPETDAAPAAVTNIHPVQLVQIRQESAHRPMTSTVLPERVIRTLLVKHTSSIVIRQQAIPPGPEREITGAAVRAAASAAPLHHPEQEEAGKAGHYARPVPQPARELELPSGRARVPERQLKTGYRLPAERVQEFARSVVPSVVEDGPWNLGRVRTHQLQHITTGKSNSIAAADPWQAVKSAGRQLRVLQIHSHNREARSSSNLQEVQQYSAPPQRMIPLSLGPGRQAAASLPGTVMQAGTARSGGSADPDGPVPAAVVPQMQRALPETLKLTAGKGVAQVLAGLAYRGPSAESGRTIFPARTVTQHAAGERSTLMSPLPASVQESRTELQMLQQRHRPVDAFGPQRRSAPPVYPVSGPALPVMPELQNRPAVNTPGRAMRGTAELPFAELLHHRPEQRKAAAGAAAGKPAGQPAERMQSPQAGGHTPAAAGPAPREAARQPKVSAEEIHQLAEQVYQVLEKRIAIRNDRRGLR